jgi:hypothetical protein
MVRKVTHLANALLGVLALFRLATIKEDLQRGDRISTERGEIRKFGKMASKGNADNCFATCAARPEACESMEKSSAYRYDVMHLPRRDVESGEGVLSSNRVSEGSDRRQSTNPRRWRGGKRRGGAGEMGERRKKKEGGKQGTVEGRMTEKGRERVERRCGEGRER